MLISVVLLNILDNHLIFESGFDSAGSLDGLAQTQVTVALDIHTLSLGICLGVSFGAINLHDHVDLVRHEESSELFVHHFKDEKKQTIYILK